MYLNIKSNIAFSFLFILTLFLSYTINTEQRNAEISYETKKISSEFLASYKLVLEETFKEADSTASIIDDEVSVQELLKESIKADPHTKHFFREKLHQHLQPLYNIIKTDGVVNLEFILKEDEIFLQMEQTKSSQKFLQGKIYQEAEFEYVEIENLLYIDYIFPIFDKENSFLGHYRIRYPAEFLQNILLNVDNFKTFVTTSNEINFAQSNEEVFSTLNGAKITSYIALKNRDKLIAYLALQTDSSTIHEILLRSYNKNFLSFFILLIIFALLYWLALNRAKVIEEKERFQLAIDSSSDGIWDWHIQKNSTYFSPRFVQMLGYEQHELELDFQTLEDIIHPEDKLIFITQINALISRDQEILDCQYRIKHRDGEWIWVHNRAKAHFDKEKKPLRVVGFLSDITLKKEYEKNQTKLIEELQNVATAKSNFLANMSHEIRTPMNAILGFIQILIRNETDEKKLKKFHIINESGKLLLKVINDILDFSKLDTKKLLIEQIPYDIHKTFKHLQELFSISAQEKSIELILNIDENLPTYTLGDKIRVEQVASNLLSNAIKFSLNSKRILLNIIYLKEDHKMRCEVVDFGIGISQSKLQDIFTPFTQEDTSTTRKFGGTGLGLSISKELCQLMGGEIGVESVVGEGSTFYFTLPLYNVNCALDESGEIHNAEDIGGDILIVEDNKTNQIFLTMFLDEYKLKYKIANDGLEALEILKTERFDLILMDENMPNMNGIEATKEIRKTQSIKDIPIIAVTASALDGDQERFIKAGMDAYLAKPIDSKELHFTLCKFLTKAKKGKANA